MYEKVLVPYVLPNNLRVIREMRGCTVKDIANRILVDRNFLSAVEQEYKNFSGKTTITTIKDMDINFYRLYDVGEVRTCEVTDDFPSTINKTLEFDLESFLNSFENNKKKNKDIFYLDIGSKVLKDNVLFNKELDIIINKNKDLGDYFDFELIKKSKKDNKIILIIDCIFTKRESRNIDFDINFALNENIKLTDKLYSMGFSESIVTWEQLIDNDRIKISGNKLILDSPFKIPRSDDINDFHITNEIHLNNVHIKEEKDGLRDNITFKYAKFKAIRPAINNLKLFRTLLNLSIEEMHNSLGLKYTAYLNLELGNQKMSSKTMWRLCYKFRIPIEVIVNIEEYHRRYCLYTKKMVKDKKMD